MGCVVRFRLVDFGWTHLDANAARDGTIRTADHVTYADGRDGQPFWTPGVRCHPRLQLRVDLPWRAGTCSVATFSRLVLAHLRGPNSVRSNRGSKQRRLRNELQ